MRSNPLFNEGVKPLTFIFFMIINVCTTHVVVKKFGDYKSKIVDLLEGGLSTHTSEVSRKEIIIFTNTFNMNEAIWIANQLSVALYDGEVIEDVDKTIGTGEEKQEEEVIPVIVAEEQCFRL